MCGGSLGFEDSEGPVQVVAGVWEGIKDGS